MTGSINDAFARIHDDVSLMAQNNHAGEGATKLLQDLSADKQSFNQDWNQIANRTVQELQAANLPQLDILNSDSISRLDLASKDLVLTTQSGKIVDFHVNSSDLTLTTNLCDASSGRITMVMSVKTDADGGKTFTEKNGSQIHIDKDGNADKIQMANGESYTKESDGWIHRQKDGIADTDPAPDKVTVDAKGVTVNWPDKSSDVYKPNGDIVHTTPDGKAVTNPETAGPGAPRASDTGNGNHPHRTHTWADDRKEARHQSLEDIKASDKHTVRRGDTLWDMSSNCLKAHGVEHPTNQQIIQEMERVKNKPENQGKIDAMGNAKIGTQIDFSESGEGSRKAKHNGVQSDQPQNPVDHNHKPGDQHHKPGDQNQKPGDQNQKPGDGANPNGQKPSEHTVKGSAGQIIHFDAGNRMTGIDYPNGTVVKVTKVDAQGNPTAMKISGNNQDMALEKQPDGRFRVYDHGQPTGKYVDDFQISPQDGSAVLHAEQSGMHGTVKIAANGAMTQELGWT